MEIPEHEARYRTLVENLPQRIFLKDRNMVYVSCNSHYARDLGIEPEKIIGKTDYDFYHAELAERYRTDDLAVIELGQGKEVEEPYIVNGEECWIHTVKTPVRDPEGKVTGVLGIFWDVTERRRADADLIRLRQAIDQSVSGLALADMESRIVFANSSWLKIHGYTLDEVMGQSLAIFHTPEQLQNEVEPFNKCVMETGSASREIGHVRKDGTTFPTWMTVALFKDPDGRPAGLIGSAIDITEQKKALEERERLLSQLTLFSAVIENTPDLVAIADLKGNLTYLNPAGLAMIGRTGQDPTRLTVFDLHPPEFFPKVQQEHVTAVREKGLHTWESFLQHLDGRQIPVSQVSILIRNEAGEPYAVSSIMRDMTRQKLAEEAQARMQQEIIQAQQHALKELATPIIPIMDHVIVMPLIGSIDTLRARDITRAMLQGVNQYHARVVIFDITGVPLVDSGVAAHLDKTIRAARLKGARTIVTGVSDAVAEAIVDLGIDWSGIETMRDLQTGLITALNSLGIKLVR